MCLACILFCLTLLSVHFMGGLYAKYTTSDSGSASARVIKFGNISISESGNFNDDGELVIIPGVNLTKKAVVNFTGSESSTYIFVEVIIDGWAEQENSDHKTFCTAGNKISWEVADGWNYLMTDSSTYVYYCALEPNAILKDIDIIKNGTIIVSDVLTAADLNSLAQTNISFRASVVQSGGFENPESAWNSIAAQEG